MRRLLREYIRQILREEVDLGKVAFGGECKDKVPFEEGFEYLDRAYKATGVEKDMLSRLLAAGENLEADLKKKFKGKEQQVIGRFLSAGSRLFSRNF